VKKTSRSIVKKSILAAFTATVSNSSLCFILWLLTEYAENNIFDLHFYVADLSIL
jgi:hypothetical protein